VIGIKTAEEQYIKITYSGHVRDATLFWSIAHVIYSHVWDKQKIIWMLCMQAAENQWRWLLDGLSPRPFLLLLLVSQRLIT